MSDIHYTIVIIAIALAIFLILYVFSSFSYKISEDFLIMQWRILKFVPFTSKKIRLADIQEARRFKLKEDLLSGGYIFGNLLTKKGVILILRKRAFFVKKIFITPDKPDTFLEQINQARR